MLKQGNHERDSAWICDLNSHRFTLPWKTKQICVELWFVYVKRYSANFSDQTKWTTLNNTSISVI